MNGDIQIEYVLKLVLVHWGHCGTDVRIIGKNKDCPLLLPPPRSVITALRVKPTVQSLEVEW